MSFLLVVVVLVDVIFMYCTKARPMFNSDEFKEKVVLVTGGSSGIGYTTALEFARQGARVIICSRDSHPGWFNGTYAVNSILNDSLVIAAGGTVRWFKADISSRESVRDLFANIENTEGQLDIAVNNAAIGGPLGHIDTVWDYLDTVNDPIRNNLYGTIYCMIQEIKYFVRENKSGIIVNIASENGLAGTVDGSLYGASKFGIVSITRSAALEFLKATESTPAIRINAVAPGLTNTSFTWSQVKWLEDQEKQVWDEPYITTASPLWQEWGPWWVEQLRGGRMAEPSEQAAMILFLSSSAASYASGSVFSVDNGDLA